MYKTKKIVFLLLLLSLSLNSLFIAQQNEDMVKKIALKLKLDKTYLNLNYMTIQLDSSITKDLQNVPRLNGQGDYSFLHGDNIQYRIVFLNKGIDLDSIYLMYIDEIKMNTLSGESFFVDESVTDDTLQVLSFKDLYAMKTNNSVQYKILINEVIQFVNENEGEALPSLLAINPDSRVRSYMGMTSKDNTDYFNFQRTNNPHYIPSKENIIKSIRRSENIGKNFRLDASFSRLTFSLKSLDYSIGSTGFEINTNEPILNLLPLESSNIFVGFRSMLRISNKKNIETATFVDAKILARINVGSNTIFENQPFVSGYIPKLNLNSGFGGELNLTRVFGLPFLTLKSYYAKTKFENPTYTIKTTDSTKSAYFSNSQFEATFSFFWNGNTKMTSQFRFDFGVSTFDIWKASYNSSNEVIYSDEESKTFISPVFGLYYTFAPSNNPLLGANLRVYDTRVSINGWIKIFEFSSQNSLRFEASTITEPLTRSLRTWESEGGVYFQFRYRYGL